MALAFFTTPTLASLATFGFGGATPATESTNSNTSESKPSDSSPKNDTGSSLLPPKSEERPVSVSAGAIIKCSDCGGDVPLMELGEHVCPPKPIPKEPSSTPPAPASAPAPAPAPAPVSVPAPATVPAPSPSPVTLTSSQQKKHESKHISQSSISKTIFAPKVEAPPSPPKSSPTPDSSPPPATQPSLVQSLFSSFMKPTAETAPTPPPTLPPTPEKSPPRPISRTSHRTPRAHRLSSSGSESSGPSNPLGRSRIPFLEKYAQLVPMNKDNNPITTTKEKTNSKPILNSNKKWEESRRSPIDTNSQSSSSSRPSNVSIESVQTSKSKSKKVITPPTSPEISPSEKIGFASLQRSQLRKDRPLPNSTSMPFDDRTRQRSGSEVRRDPKPLTIQKLPSSQSASAGLDRLLASEAFLDCDEEKDHLSSKAFETPKLRSKASQKPIRKPSDGLEDLMGDLMNEMTRKAELSTYQLKEKKKSTPSRTTPSPAIKSPHKRSATESDAMYDIHDPDMTPRTHLRNNSANNLPNVPDSPGIRPSDSISQLGFDHPPSPPPARALFSTKPIGDDRCQNCGKRTDSRTAKVRSSSIDPSPHNGSSKASLFCQTCYAELYLPKCRKCERPIERRAVTDRVGKVLGKYHPECFNCFQCSALFPDGEFYVWERKPVCARHYHRFAGTICANESCQRGIEGPCVSLSLESSEPGRSASDVASSFSKSSSGTHRRRLYHPEHFTCTRKGCKISLEEFHFVINGQPWCEHHARIKQSESFADHSNNNPSDPTLNPPWTRKPSRDQASSSRPMERRRTIIQNLRKR